MITKPEDNSANKTFADAVEDLLTRNSHDYHTLFTELSTTAAAYVDRQKTTGARTQIVEALALLHKSLSDGWLTGLHEEPCPLMTDLACPWSTRIQALLRPFAAKGHYFGLMILQDIMRRGHHRSQTRAVRQHITHQAPPPAA